MTKRRKDFGDSNYPGRGAIRCHACGKPLLEHKMTAFCEAMKVPSGTRVTTPRRVHSQQKGPR